MAGLRRLKYFSQDETFLGIPPWCHYHGADDLKIFGDGGCCGGDGWCGGGCDVTWKWSLLTLGYPDRHHQHQVQSQVLNLEDVALCLQSDEDSVRYYHYQLESYGVGYDCDYYGGGGIDVTGQLQCKKGGSLQNLLTAAALMSQMLLSTKKKTKCNFHINAADD